MKNFIQQMEKEFEKEFCDENRPDWITETQRSWRIKDFISQQLKSFAEKCIKLGEEMIKVKINAQDRDGDIWWGGFDEGVSAYQEAIKKKINGK